MTRHQKVCPQTSSGLSGWYCSALHIRQLVLSAFMYSHYPLCCCFAVHAMVHSVSGHCLCPGTPSRSPGMFFRLCPRFIFTLHLLSCGGGSFRSVAVPPLEFQNSRWGALPTEQMGTAFPPVGVIQGMILADYPASPRKAPSFRAGMDSGEGLLYSSGR